MNKGITSKQVEEALGLVNSSSIATVSEWAGHRQIPYKPHRYELVIDGDMDISMAELQALVALFGTTHVCGKFTQAFGDDDESAFYFEVSE